VAQRQVWASKLGFVLAASGSAIGLGNIVFFGANAYKYGGGAFYVPYLVALAVVGIPVMMLEFGIGHSRQAAFPIALRQMVGAPGEFVGWWALLNAGVISLYYVTLLGWVLGMLLGAFGPLWEPTHPTPNFAPEALPNPVGYFFDTLSRSGALVNVAIVWLLTVLICSKGTKTIEAAVRFFVPAMWIMMLVLIVRGVTLPHGWDGVAYLFNPDFSAMGEAEVWRGAFGQIFFSLSLGFGLMSAYASYLPKDANIKNFAAQTSLLNCSFEYVSGFAIFSMLFAFAIVPKASTLAMSFFVLPEGIAALPGGVRVFGVLFFLLLLLAGISSAISLVEGVCSAFIDKWHVSRRSVLTGAFVVGFLGSSMFALPKVIDPGLEGDGTLGLTLLDLFDNKAFGYGLLVVGLLECVLIAWVYGIKRFVRERNGGAAPSLFDRAFIALVGGIIPVTLAYLLYSAIRDERRAGLYGKDLVDPAVIGGDGAWSWLATAVPAIWLLGTVGLALLLTLVKGRPAPAGVDRKEEALG
jgi:NSS family neurotransmitter:Na+ symporter